jgi:phage terminase small subunit
MSDDLERRSDLARAIRAHKTERTSPPVTREMSVQRRDVFAAEYAATGDRVAAAKAAGYTPKEDAASTHLMHPQVRQRVTELNQAKMAAAGITAQRVMQEIGRIAFLDIRKLYDANGDLKPISELDDDTAAAVAAVDVETRWEGKGNAAEPVTTKKVRTVDKMAGLNLLAKHFKLVGDEGDGVSALASALADRLRTARRRADQVEDAVLVEPEQVAYDPDANQPPPDEEYCYEDDPLG